MHFGVCEISCGAVSSKVTIHIRHDEDLSSVKSTSWSDNKHRMFISKSEGKKVMSAEQSLKDVDKQMNIAIKGGLRINDIQFCMRECTRHAVS